jgi:hypothetical protein
MARGTTDPKPGMYELEPGSTAQAKVWRVVYDIPKSDRVYRSDVMHSEIEVGRYLDSMREGRPDITSYWVVEFTLTETADAYVPQDGDFAAEDGA